MKEEKTIIEMIGDAVGDFNFALKILTINMVLLTCLYMMVRC
jgi:hypothetical protein